MGWYAFGRDSQWTRKIGEQRGVTVPEGGNSPKTDPRHLFPEVSASVYLNRELTGSLLSEQPMERYPNL